MQKLCVHRKGPGKGDSDLEEGALPGRDWYLQGSLMRLGTGGPRSPSAAGRGILTKI